MKTVQVLLRENVLDLGRCGDVVKVAAGYARNYLVPKRIAVEATEENVRLMLRRRARLDEESMARSAETAARIATLEALVLETAETADEGGHLYGSVNAAAIAKLLAAAGQEIDEKDVRLSEPIKELGTHRVCVHVHGEHEAAITVRVEAAS